MVEATKSKFSGLPWAILSAPHARVFGRVRAWRLDLWIAVGAFLRIVNIPGGQRATVPHDKVSKQGLDLVAVYDDDGLAALCVGESKASNSHAASHLNSAIRLFRGIDSGLLPVGDQRRQSEGPRVIGS